MILDVILLGLRKIALNQRSDVVILPGMRIDHEAQISHPVTGYELWLSGDADYVVIEYENVRDNKARLLFDGGCREVHFRLAKSCLFLVEVKRKNLKEWSRKASWPVVSLKPLVWQLRY